MENSEGQKSGVQINVRKNDDMQSGDSQKSVYNWATENDGGQKGNSEMVTKGKIPPGETSMVNRGTVKRATRKKAPDKRTVYKWTTETNDDC